METLKTTFGVMLFILFSFTNLTAQNSVVAYETDGLSGKLDILKSDFVALKSYSWNINVPINVPVKVSRVNNLYADNIEILVDGKISSILSNSGASEHSETIYSTSGKLTIKMVPLSYSVNTTNSIIVSIKFARLNSENSETTVLKGDLELESGIIRAYGKQDFLGSKTSAILGKDYESYTLFGGVNGGRIRGSQEGYLVLEGNPAGYGTRPTVYINRFVSNSKTLIGSASGSVGIGIDDPKTTLHIGGAIRGNKTGGALEIKTENGSLVVGAQNNIATQFETTSPKFAFNKDVDVKGTIRSTEILIESVDNFADFVFEKDYKIRSLSEVEEFITNNGHLPEIPSAREVKENGMSLVEMQVKLLQKVEELTLYVIQQDQKSIEQQNTIDRLKKEIEDLKKK